MSRTKRLIAGSSISVAILGLVALTATPAAADTPHCSGALCAQLVGVSPEAFSIAEWSENNFTGHFQLQTPAGANKNTGDKSWSALEVVHFPTTRLNGQYCANEWQHNSSGGYDRLGGICWTINT